jgi:uncharacterized protein (DUF1684 family)
MESELQQFRAAKDDFFAHDRHSPLTREQKKKFSGLSYFPAAPELLFELEVEPFPEVEEIEIQTSTGDVQTYRRYGRVRFAVEGQEQALTLFASESGFFLPFVDSLAGKETYPAGRYLEPEILPTDRVLIDFNLAYNPYCAYNEAWSCPLTPFENRLKAPIRAGEKLPEGDWVDLHA